LVREVYTFGLNINLTNYIIKNKPSFYIFKKIILISTALKALKTNRLKTTLIYLSLIFSITKTDKWSLEFEGLA